MANSLPGNGQCHQSKLKNDFIVSFFKLDDIRVENTEITNANCGHKADKKVLVNPKDQKCPNSSLVMIDMDRMDGREKYGDISPNYCKVVGPGEIKNKLIKKDLETQRFSLDISPNQAAQASAAYDIEGVGYG